MRHFSRIWKLAALAFIIVLAGAMAWVYVASPALLRVGAGYAAKIVCSNVFLAERDADDVLAVDVQAPGHPLLRLMAVDVDREQRRVRAALLGFLASNEAFYRVGLGCAVAPGGEVAQTSVPSRPSAGAMPLDAPWPAGEAVQTDQMVQAVLSDTALIGPGMRAVVVLRGGRIVGEAYGEGFSAKTPLLGWSMTKTVNAVIIGRMMQEGRIRLDDRNLLDQWREDTRGEITLAHLLAMEDGLAFNENYGTVADVTRMLYLEPDMAQFAADAPLAADAGGAFNYSSGTAVLLSRIWMDRAGDPAAALGYPRQALFGPIGMNSAVLEADARGTFVGSSYMYATARDWGRLALLLLRDGVWNGERLLPQGFVKMMSEPNRHSQGRYSKMQTWLGGGGDTGLPPDTFFLSGHDGQTIAVIPSLDLAVIRLGLTPRATGYEVTPLVRAVMERR